MAKSPPQNLLARLARGTDLDQQSDPFAAVAASRPEHEPNPDDKKLDRLISRIRHIATPEDEPDTTADPTASLGTDDNPFVPVEPESFRQAGLTDGEVEALVLKYLLVRGNLTGRDVAEQIKLPFVLVDELLRQLKADQLVVHRGAAAMNDYEYQLSDLGRERARRFIESCSYFGSAPVALEDYVRSVTAQSLTAQNPSPEALERAFQGLLLNEKMFDRLGPAVNSGRGLFLFGSPGNGKTSIAERITGAFGRTIWIPRAIGVDGEIIRLFDPINHTEAPVETNQGLIDRRRVDKRWVRIRRPTILAGGELTMSALEVTINRSTGICEAPLQLKSNCGTLVIDDFGRQRMPVAELLNRWIVPLETRFDFLSLPNGKKISVPFDQLVIFSTNLEPRDLVDEAFLRRIPYKIEAVDPTENEFRELFRVLSAEMGIEYRPEPIDHLVNTHYRAANRPFRFCHPRDLLLQIRNYCIYHKTPMVLSNEYVDKACENYFAVM